MLKIKSYICTRKGQKPPTLDFLLSYLGRNDIEPVLLSDKNSIFSAYEEQFKLDQETMDDEDIIIMCHDDIEILTDGEIFETRLIEGLIPANVGFVGVAGTTKLEKDAVWWNHNNWSAGLHRGLVFHGDSLEDSEPSWYGKPGQVVALDGLFLAAKVRTLKDTNLSKPRDFEGEWDFYDLWYTVSTHEKGYNNMVIPIFVRHQSKGELVGRDSWHNNRQAFIRRFRLPIKCQPPN